MDRRSFLKLLAGSAAAVAAGELLLPKRTFFLPPPGGWALGNVDVEAIIKKALARDIAKSIDRGVFDYYYAPAFPARRIVASPEMARIFREARALLDTEIIVNRPIYVPS